MSADWQAQRAYVAERYDADVRAAGFGEVWDHILTQPDTATRGILLGCIGAVATYINESGLTPLTHSPASPTAAGGAGSTSARASLP